MAMASIHAWISVVIFGSIEKVDALSSRELPDDGGRMRGRVCARVRDGDAGGERGVDGGPSNPGEEGGRVLSFKPLGLIIGVGAVDGNAGDAPAVMDMRPMSTSSSDMTATARARNVRRLRQRRRPHSRAYAALGPVASLSPAPPPSTDLYTPARSCKASCCPRSHKTFVTNTLLAHSTCSLSLSLSV
jgi:hypothetical protein